MSAITELYDPGYHVNGGTPPGTMGETMEKLKSDCGWIIDGIDWVITKFWHTSLREAIITKLAGDFNAMSSMQTAWSDVALALQELSENYGGLSGQLPAVWEGQGGETAVSRMDDIRDMHADQAEAAGLIHDQLGNLIDVSVAAAEVVVGALHLINDIAQELISDAAVPLVGWGKALLTGAGKVKRAISLIHKCLEAIEKITTAIKIALKGLTWFNAGMTVLNSLLKMGEVGTAGYDGSSVDRTAEAGFG
ncbi:hypothetical protein AB3X52_06190 [Nocardioides sp. DS6]|uniref:WXG100 family type VII secretion target n=1 Tax=Nocardioides eburneus TaxID=3231482 RepID=A0ABV3SW89_9ACTN